MCMVLRKSDKSNCMIDAEERIGYSFLDSRLVIK